MGLLVLSRQRDETILIGDRIQITVVDIRGDKVRLGIDAPRELSVHRKEVYDAIKRENRNAASVNLVDRKFPALQASSSGFLTEGICETTRIAIDRLYREICDAVNAGGTVRDETRNASASLLDLWQSLDSLPRDAFAARALLIGIRVCRRNLQAGPNSFVASAIKGLLDLIPHLELAIDASEPRETSPLAAALPAAMDGKELLEKGAGL